MDNMNSAAKVGRQRYYKKLPLVFGIVALAGIFVIFFPEHMHLLLLIVALLLIYTGAIWLNFYRKLNRWNRIDAIITAIAEQQLDEVESQYSTRTYLFPVIDYEYQLNGMTHRSSRVGHELENIWVPEVDNWGMKTKATDKFWSDWQVGTRIPVYIDPKNSGRSVIINQPGKQRKSHHLALLVAGFILLVAWAFLLTVI